MNHQPTSSGTQRLDLRLLGSLIEYEPSPKGIFFFAHPANCLRHRRSLMAVICGGVTTGRTRMPIPVTSCSRCSSRISLSLDCRNKVRATSAALLSSSQPPYCRAAKQQQQRDGSVKKKGGGRRKISESPTSREPVVEVVPSTSNLPKGHNASFPLPKPPAGFVVDALGKVLLASPRRIATIVSVLHLNIILRYICSNLTDRKCMVFSFYVLVCYI